MIKQLHILRGVIKMIEILPIVTIMSVAFVGKMMIKR